MTTNDERRLERDGNPNIPKPDDVGLATEDDRRRRKSEESLVPGRENSYSIQIEIILQMFWCYLDDS